MTEKHEVLNNRGWTSKVYILPGEPPRICKAFNKDCVNKHFPTERKAYERFTAHNHPSSILKYYGVHESISAGLILELAEETDVIVYLHDQREAGRAGPDNEVLYRWAEQATEALEFAHSLGVYNSDIHCVNFFLDRDLNLKVGDWAGASIDGSRSCSSYRLKYRSIDADGKDVPRKTGITAATEIFALGTAMYHMVTGHEPWPELGERKNSEEIRKKIREKDFPDTSKLPVLGDVIRKCWQVGFVSMTEVKRAIEAESKKHGLLFGRDSERSANRDEQ